MTVRSCSQTWKNDHMLLMRGLLCSKVCLPPPFPPPFIFLAFSSRTVPSFRSFSFLSFLSHLFLSVAFTFCFFAVSFLSRLCAHGRSLAWLLSLSLSFSLCSLLAVSRARSLSFSVSHALVRACALSPLVDTRDSHHTHISQATRSLWKNWRRNMAPTLLPWHVIARSMSTSTHQRN